MGSYHDHDTVANAILFSPRAIRPDYCVHVYESLACQFMEAIVLPFVK